MLRKDSLQMWIKPYSVLQGYILLITVLSLFLLSISSSLTFAQPTNAEDTILYSEAPIIFENGIKKSNALTVKFRIRVLDLPKGVREAGLEQIDPAFSNITRFFDELQLKYPDVTLRKQIPNAVWGDTLRVNRNSGRQVSVHDMSQLFTVKFSQFVPIDSLIQELEQLPEVEYAHQPVQVILAVDPDDPNYPANQWNLTKVNAAAAWDITRGSSSIVVGIIDPKGVKRAHEDFTNRDQTSQFVAGKGDTEFTESHGTQVAGVVAAATDNTKGIASLGWNIKMIPYKWDNAEDFDEASAQNLANKIFEARNDPIDVLNLSFFTGIEFLNILDCPPKECVRSEDYNSVRDEIENAINSGIIVVASTGNGPINQQLGRGWCFDCESFPYIPYPAAYPGVIGVSATEQDDSFHTGYNYETGDGGEADFIDVAAPGKDILSTSISGYYSEDGTSFAAPLVAALAGLVKSVNPNLSRSQVEQIITSTTLDLGASGRDNFYGYGRIQAQEAVLKAAKKSLNADATAHNGGRRLVRDSSGNYHLIFGSNGEIFYRKIVGGSSWQSAHQLSSGNGNNNFPSIAERGGKVFVTWQRNTGSSHDVYFHKSTDGGASWPSGNRQVLATNVGTSDPLPVIASPATNELMLVYRSNSGLVWKRSTDNGANWTTSGVFTGSTFNSPSVAPGKTPWNADITVLAYATAEIPNTSDIKVDYHSSSWSNEKNLTSDLPGNLSQHAHPSIAFSGNFNSITHVAWDAHDSFRSARVILHKKMGFWSVPSTYHEFYYQTEDRPSITGLAGSKAAIAYRRGSAYVFTRTFDGSYWSSFASAAGMYPSFSVGSTQARYVTTSGSAAPYEIDLSSTTFSKSGVLVENTGTTEGSSDFAYLRAVGLKDKESGAWLNVRVENFVVKHRDGRVSNIGFSVAPSDTVELSAEQAWSALASADFTLPTDADSLIVVFAVAGEKVANLANGPGALEILFQIQNPLNKQLDKKFQPLRFASNDAFSRPHMRVGLSSHSFASGVVLNFKTMLNNQKSDSILVASLGHVYDYSENSTSPGFKQASSTHSNLSRVFGLAQNYPNPFNPETTL